MSFKRQVVESKKKAIFVASLIYRHVSTCQKNHRGNYRSDIRTVLCEYLFLLPWTHC